MSEYRDHNYRAACGDAVLKLPAGSKNRDTCIAIAGLPGNNTIAIRKYCVPKAQGRSVRSASSETWFVWYSEEWTSTLVDLKFLDTVTGDAVVALRDNKGRTLDTGPLEHFVSIHPRRIQEDPVMYDALYGSSKGRIERLMIISLSSEVRGLNPLKEEMLAITDMLVIPTGEDDGRQPWVLLSTIVGTVDEVGPEGSGPLDEDAYSAADQTMNSGSGGIHNSYRKDVCIKLDLNQIVTFAGAISQKANLCNLNSFFEVSRDAGYSAVVLAKEKSLTEADVALLPSRKGFDMCILRLTFSSLNTLAPPGFKTCFTTPDSFSTGGNFPLRNSWADIQREMFLTGKLVVGCDGAGTNFVI